MLPGTEGVEGVMSAYVEGESGAIYVNVNTPGEKFGTDTDELLGRVLSRKDLEEGELP